MADLIGIEVSNEIYGLQDETARAAADNAESKAENAASSVASLEENLANEIGKVIGRFLTTRTVLWTNPNRGQQFARQAVAIPNFADYDEVHIVIDSYNGQSTAGTIIAGKIEGTQSFRLRVNQVTEMLSSTWTVLANREISVTPDTNDIVFFDANAITFKPDGSQSFDTNNSLLVPMQVIGVKYGATPSA